MSKSKKSKKGFVEEKEDNLNTYQSSYDKPIELLNFYEETPPVSKIKSPITFASIKNDDGSIFNKFSTTDQVKKWLISQGFNTNVHEELSSFSGEDMWELTRQDCKDLFGDVVGIRLYNRIKSSKTLAQQQEAERNQEEVLGMTYSAYGQCSETGCFLPAIHECTSAKSEFACSKLLCIHHAQKSLLSGCIYCAYCFEHATITKTTAIEATRRIHEECIIM